MKSSATDIVFPSVDFHISNEKESVRWIATAAARGHEQAKQALARINASHDERRVISAPVR